MSKRAARPKSRPVTEIGSFVAWLSVDNGGHERLMVWIGEDGANIPLLAFDRASEDRTDELARIVVDQTGRPGRKVIFHRDMVVREIF